MVSSVWCFLFLVVQVRNLCYMVSRREKLKLLQSKAQEQMFNLHVKLVNQELSAGEPSVVPQLASRFVALILTLKNKLFQQYFLFCFSNC